MITSHEKRTVARMPRAAQTIVNICIPLDTGSPASCMPGTALVAAVIASGPAEVSSEGDGISTAGALSVSLLFLMVSAIVRPSVYASAAKTTTTVGGKYPFLPLTGKRFFYGMPC